MVTIIQAIVMMLIYYQVTGDKAGVQNRRGALFFACLLNGFGGINNVVLVFPAERGVFLREVNNNMYTTSAYFWGKLVTELPLAVFFPIVQVAIYYWAIGFNTQGVKVLIHLLISFLEYNAFGGFGFILGTAIANKVVITVMTPIVVVPMMLFAGFFVNQSNVPEWLYFLRETSIFKYAYQAFFLNEFEGLEMECMTETDVKKFCDPIADYDSPQGMWLSIIILTCIWVLCTLIAFLILRSKAKSID